MAFIPEIDHLKIPLEHIRLATKNFSNDNFIGQGGFGRVYKGQLPNSTRYGEAGISIAVKRLDVKITGQGEREFLMEVVMLSSYKHDHLVSFVGFSDEDDEKILVYKHEVNGSLDMHLATTDLTWERRLRICIGAARGLNYLHCGVGTGHRVLHRDIKSSNILLDKNWEAKISDFGLSKIGPTNQEFTCLVTAAAGTFGYLDPKYYTTGVLTKESDVFSFGVVLFEVLCGRLAMIAEYHDVRRFLYKLVKHCYEEDKLDEIIRHDPLKQIHPNSLEAFTKVAYQCLNKDRKKRPTMAFVVQELKHALDLQLDPQTRLWGSNTGGHSWLFKLVDNQKLRKITIDHEGWIHSIAFTAENSDGMLLSPEKHGGESGPSNGKISEINFDVDEEIIGISGTSGIHHGLHVISSLCFVTNKKNYGTFGIDHGLLLPDRFSKSWDMGMFVGFSGRSGWFLDGIRPCLKDDLV